MFCCELTAFAVAWLRRPVVTVDGALPCGVFCASVATGLVICCVASCTGVDAAVLDCTGDGDGRTAGAPLDTGALSAATTEARSERTTDETSSVLAVPLVSCWWAGSSFAELASKRFPAISFCCPVPFCASLAIVSIRFCNRSARASASCAAFPGGPLPGGESAFAIVCFTVLRSRSRSLAEYWPLSRFAADVLILWASWSTIVAIGVPFCNSDVICASRSAFVDVVEDGDEDDPLAFASEVPNSDAQCAPLPLPLACAVLPVARCAVVAGSTDVMESMLI